MSTDFKIQKAFLDGIELVFSTIFTQYCYVSLMDEFGTMTNIYGESTDKVYTDPIPLVAKVSTDFSLEGELPSDIKVDAFIKVPTKQLLKAGLITKEYVTEEELEKLRKAKFTYGGIDYLVSYIQPKTLIADIWHFYDFYCYVDKKSGSTL